MYSVFALPECEFSSVLSVSPLYHPFISGFSHRVDEIVPQLLSALDSPVLGLMQWHEELAVIRWVA